MKTIDIKSSRQIKEEETEQLKRDLEKAQQSVQRQKHVIKFLLYILLSLIITGAWFYTYKKAEGWWMKRLIVSASPSVHRAQAKEVEKPKTYTIDQIVDAVHILESSGGVKDGCIAKGKINGYGYAQHGSGDVWTCFKTHAQVRALVEQWYAKRIPELGLSTALCYYNLGKVDGQYVNDCKYYQDFLKVVKS